MTLPLPARTPRALLRNALLLRVGAALFIHFVFAEGFFAPDEFTYDLFSAWLARSWTGETLLSPSEILRQGEPRGYYYIVATLYMLFGHWSLLPKLVNAVVGTVTVNLIFDLTLRVTADANAALRAAKYVTYFPSLILWSALNIRDCWVVLLIVLICRQALAVQDSPRLSRFLMLGLAVLVVTQFRAYLLFAVTLPMLISFLVRQRAHVLRNTVVGMLAAGIVIYADAAAGRGRRMRIVDFEELQTSRAWSASAAQSGFAKDADISSPGKALAFLPIGLTYFLLAPFPWTLANARQGFTLPEMLFFYTLLPFIFRGLFLLARNRLADSLMIMLLTGGITLGYAVGQGNVGTIYRHRAQVLPFFLVFAAVGVEARRQRQAAPAAMVAQRPQPFRVAS